jgi:hypothetical protein
MPNWCDNNVMIKGGKEEIAAIREKINKDNNPFSFDAIKPMPTALRNVSAPARSNEDPQKVEFNVKKYGAADWYEWANGNWGTKWDSSEASLHVNSDELLHYSFSTAWAPPFPVYEALSEQFPNTNIFINYDETGGDFSGWKLYKDGMEQQSHEYDGSYGNMRMYMEPESDVFDWLR